MSHSLFVIFFVFAGVVGSVGLVFWVKFFAKMFCEGMAEAARKKRGKEMIARAKKIGCLVRRHTIAGVNGIVANADFLTTYARYYDEVDRNERKLTDKVVLRIKPTFTSVLEDSAETPMHTCQDSAMMEVLDHIVEVVTGIKKNEVRIFDFQEASKAILSKDGRIFVPFAGGMPDVKEQVLFYGRTTIQEASEYLISKIPAAGSLRVPE